MRDSYDYSVAIPDKRFNSLDRDIANSLSLNTAVSDYDRKFLEYLVSMHNVLRADKIDINKFENVLDALEHMRKEQGHEYLNTLIHPETVKGSKIPSQIPVPSSSFQLHNSAIISTNASGHAALFFNPFYLAGAGANSTLFVNNSAALTGTATSDAFTAVNIGQVIPPVYNQYRVVSASIVIKYVGRLDIVQGVIGGAIVFDQNAVPTAHGTNSAALAKYGDFNLAMDAFYTQENLTLNGIRELYFPLDTTYEQYQSLGVSKNGFGMLAYIFGGVPSAPAYKVDVYVNYECLPDSAFLNYLPTSLCTSGGDRKQEAIQTVQQKPITDEGDSRNSSKKQSGGFWNQIKSTLGDVLPAAASIASMLFPQSKAAAAFVQASRY